MMIFAIIICVIFHDSFDGNLFTVTLSYSLILNSITCFFSVRP